jgi:glycosyltransferase involved in cell wall biosynthesis
MVEAHDSVRIRILYTDTEDVWRGGQEQLLGLMAGMRSMGHDVWLASPPGSPLGRRALRAGVTVVPFVQRSELSPVAAIRFHRLLRNRRFDIIHFNTPKPVVAGCLAARLARIPVAVCSRRVNFPLRSRLSALKYNLCLDRVFTVSTSIRKTLLTAGVREDLVEVVYEGVNLDWIDRLPPAPLPIDSPPAFLIGTVAHLSAEKGHLTLLEAARLLSLGGERFHLALVGDGDLRLLLESKVVDYGLEAQVTFAGFRSDSEALMKRFDVFCLPSLSEGLSSAILAAMASRLPVVSTLVGGIPELVLDGSTGFLVPANHPGKLAEALSKLIRDPALRKSFGEAGRRRVEESFTIRRKLEATDRAYRGLLRRQTVR